MKTWPQLLALLALTSIAAGCASRYKADANAPTYAAKAKLRVKVNKTDNRELSVRMDHLAPPSRIDPAYRAYVVWLAVPGHGVTKAGTLDYDEKRRRGDLFATSPHSRFEVIVSLERDPSTQAPSDAIILRKVVGRG